MSYLVEDHRSASAASRAAEVMVVELGTLVEGCGGGMDKIVSWSGMFPGLIGRCWGLKGKKSLHEVCESNSIRTQYRCRAGRNGMRRARRL